MAQEKNRDDGRLNPATSGQTRPLQKAVASFARLRARSPTRILANEATEEWAETVRILANAATAN